MAMRSHLFPYRTQKLSSSVSKILGWRRPGKIERCRYNDKNSLSGLQMGSFCCVEISIFFRQSFYQSNVYVAIFAHKCLTKAFFSFIVDMCHFLSNNNGWRRTNECPEKRGLGKDFSLDYADRRDMLLFTGAYGVCSGCKI